MCGISGSFSTIAKREWTSLIQEIVVSQKKRGPDFSAVEPIDGKTFRCALGHNRLSILDLNERSNQPFWDESRRYCLTYNGEIYNYLELREELEKIGHRFKTTSDTEVLLEGFKAWGLACAERFNGMFAFALVDKEKSEIHLCRDRFGVKPLYYHLSGGDLLFASTGRVIASRLGLTPNLEYVSQGLRYWFYQDGGSISPYNELHGLPAGHWLTVKAIGGKLEAELTRHYDLTARIHEQRESLMGQSVPRLVEAVSETLSSAVALRLRSDVPVGISLSGGLDSSSLAALLSEQREGTVGFTYGSPDARSSEGPLVEELSRKLKIQVDYIWPDPKEVTEAFWDCLAAQDAPFTGPSLIAQFLVFKKARARGFKVLLGGQGGDEAFLGYRKFQVFRFRRLVEQKKFAAALSFVYRALPLVAAELPSARSYWKHRRRYLSRTGNESALRLPDCRPLALGYDGKEELWTRQLRDIVELSLPTLLRYEDRNSMGNSIESRLPFLDYRLMELALALPDAVKVNRGFGKWVLRETVKGRVPDAIRLARYKKGFSVSEGSWIQNGLGKSLRDHLKAQSRKLEPFMKSSDPEVLFSDDALLHRPAAFAEAVSLAWLSQRAH